MRGATLEYAVTQNRGGEPDVKTDILTIGGAIGAAVAYFLKRMDGRAVLARNFATQQRHGCHVL